MVVTVPSKSGMIVAFGLDRYLQLIRSVARKLVYKIYLLNKQVSNLIHLKLITKSNYFQIINLCFNIN